MKSKKQLVLSLFLPLFLYASESVSLQTLNGSWHLRIMDGYKVHTARAILDFNAKHKKIDGFDGCNRISGKLIRNAKDHYISKLSTQTYTCRQTIQRYVSKRLHQTIEEGFTIQKATMQGEDGILIQSIHHTLFFKKMGRDWLPPLKDLSLKKVLF